MRRYPCVCCVSCLSRSLPEEKVKAQVMLDTCQQSLTPSMPSPEGQKSHAHPAGADASAPSSEPRKSRVRERRREGRSKTFDWSEFKMEQREKPAKARADTVDLSSSLSTASSCFSPTSSPSSSASSPVSTSSLKTSSLSGHLPCKTDEMEKENLWRGTPTSSTAGAAHVPKNTATTSVSNAAPPAQASISDSQEQGKMEVDHPAGLHRVGSDRGGRSTDVQEEIEQRWHQVETTPLREEKQVPISTTLGTSANSDRLPAHELAALLDKEVCVRSKYSHAPPEQHALTLFFVLQLGQKQKELDQLQKQNSVLKEQLESALGREQSAREGYVLQVLSKHLLCRISHCSYIVYVECIQKATIKPFGTISFAGSYQCE